jgi:energy-coupling factor transport system substrate-specific component
MNQKLTVREIALFAMLGGITFAGKMAMAALPNIEPVSLMVMLCAVVWGRKCFFPVGVYVGLELLIWGIGSWNVNYLYVWFLLAGVALMMRRMESPLGWALLSGAFGLFFGALCVPVHVLMGGWAYGLSWWIEGIPFDLLHCAGNFVMALVLFKPMRILLERLLERKQGRNRKEAGE